MKGLKGLASCQVMKQSQLFVHRNKIMTNKVQIFRTMCSICPGPIVGHSIFKQPCDKTDISFQKSLYLLTT